MFLGSNKFFSSGGSMTIIKFFGLFSTFFLGRQKFSHQLSVDIVNNQKLMIEFFKHCLKNLSNENFLKLGSMAIFD